MSYSKDLRTRVVEFIESGGGKTEACRLFGVSRHIIYKWCRIKKETGDVVDKPPNRKPWKKINSDVLLARVEKNPEAKQSEHASFFNVSVVAISKALRRLKITRKKRLYFTKKKKKKSVKYLQKKLKI